MLPDNDQTRNDLFKLTRYQNLMIMGVFEIWIRPSAFEIWGIQISFTATVVFKYAQLADSETFIEVRGQISNLWSNLWN